MVDHALGIRLADAAAAYRRGWSAGWRVPEPLLVDEWADSHRILTKATSKEEGPWRTDRTPYLREPMRTLSTHSPTRTVTCCFSTQIGKTEIGLNFSGYVIDHAPGPMIAVQPTGDMALRWSRQRLDVMIRESPALGRRVRPPRSQGSNNTAKMKEFPGGFLVIGQAESPSSLSSMPARFSFLDEVDSYPADTGGEGDPIDIAERRTDSFGSRAKNLRVSSVKKIKGASLIWREYLAGDQSRYFVPCPHCDESQVLDMDNVLPSGDYLCEHCGTPIEHSEKTGMLTRGEWRAEYPERSDEHRSFHLSALYAPVGLGKTWKQLHAEREQAHGDPVKEKTFLSTRLSIPYESNEGKIDPRDIELLREDWNQREIPPGVLLLTAGVDVQKDRLHLHILGFSRGPQISIIDRAEIGGSPLEPDTWAELDRYLSTPILNAWGVEMLPSRVAVDSGNWTDAVYTAVRERQSRGWIAVKGHSTRGKTIIGRPSLQDVNVQGRTLKQGLKLYMLGVDTAKDELLDRLALSVTKPNKQDRWFHLPGDISPEFFDQITAERKDPESEKWVKVRSRNEDIDVLVYGYAAARLPQVGRPGVHVMRESDWSRLEARNQPATADLFAEPGGSVSTAPASSAGDMKQQRQARRPAIDLGADDWGSRL